MTEVWVLWWSRKENIIARGYWDQAFLEDVVAGVVWHAPMVVHHAYTVAEVPPGAAVLLVVPARHHADPDSVAELVRAVLALQNVVVVLTGDEDHVFPVREFNERALATVWVQNPSLDVARSSWRVLGCGYTTHVRTAVLAASVEHVSNRDLKWAYLGQTTTPRREQLRDVLDGMEAFSPGSGRAVHSPGFTRGISREDYAATMLRARVAPAPAGPGCPDTFRLFEALEAGCVPVGDEWTKHETLTGYFEAMFGEAPPFPIVEDWAGLEPIVSDVSRHWPWRAARVLSWWGRYKHRTAKRLLVDLGVNEGVDGRVTVLMPTSPVPSAPSIATIEATIESVRRYLPYARIIVMCDGVRAEQLDRVRDYDEYCYRLAWQASTVWRNVDVVMFDEHQHQGVMTRTVIEQHVATPLVLFVEHDTPLTGDIDFAALERPLLADQINVLRFHHEAAVHPEHEWLSPSTAPRDIMGVPAIPTMQWSQRPHLARTVFYADILARYFGWESRTMIEDVMHGVCEVAWRTHGSAGHNDWRIFLYAPPGSMVRSLHSDGREGDPKFDMLYAYDGRTPFGAPTPTRER